MSNELSAKLDEGMPPEPVVFWGSSTHTRDACVVLVTDYDALRVHALALKAENERITLIARDRAAQIEGLHPEIARLRADFTAECQRMTRDITEAIAAERERADAFEAELESERAARKSEATITCDCGFRYGAEHTIGDGSYECPVCAEGPLQAELAALRAGREDERNRVLEEAARVCDNDSMASAEQLARSIRSLQSAAHVKAVETEDEMMARISKIITEEGGGPESSIHGHRCTFPPGRTPCDCVDQIAQRIMDEVVRSAHVRAGDDK